MPTACLPLHAHQFTLRITNFLFFFHHFQLFVFVNFKLTCFEVLEYAGHPFGQLDFFPRGSLPKEYSSPQKGLSLLSGRNHFCFSSSALIQCTADAVTCPLSGQVCIQSDGNKCCQIETAGIPASEINSKSGSCPRPLGISVFQDAAIGCWMDSNCPGIQKCCVEPNPVTNSATRICRDPVGVRTLINTLARLFTRYLSECKVPSQWKTSRTVLLYKRGDVHDIGNYRPICLLSVVYKLFTRVILNRISRTLDEGQPREQAGFRRGFSTIDHIHTITKLIEVSREYSTVGKRSPKRGRRRINPPFPPPCHNSLQSRLYSMKGTLLESEQRDLPNGVKIILRHWVDHVVLIPGNFVIFEFEMT
ncbi:unnamed protein product [Heligmosomoides polygyrus]|uniref:WAP domain-containing protein n=1 Tax=Heligmosomoides polygyrus TaxID=6339 RepID=A0A183GIT2_HELPZ|nr:unnamed protein product [Heligmosomoides polygyrus]